MSSLLGSTSVRDETASKYELQCTSIAESLVKLVTLDDKAMSHVKNDLIEAENEINQCEMATNLMIEASKDIKESILPMMDKDFNDFSKIYNILDILDDTVLPSLANDLNELENLVSHVEQYAQCYKSKIASNNTNPASSVASGWNGMNIFPSSLLSRNENTSEIDIDHAEDITPNCNLCNPENLIKLLNKNENRKISVRVEEAV